MRELKFRVWCKNRNEWERDRVFIDSNGYQYHTEGLMHVKPENHIIMQFTGLLDKNGKEIYEGDILLEKNCRVWREYTKDDGTKWSKMTNKTEDRLYQVFYDEKTCQFTTNRGWLWTLSNLTEVIGNIYENPELLKDGE